MSFLRVTIKLDFVVGPSDACRLLQLQDVSRHNEKNPNTFVAADKMAAVIKCCNKIMSPELNLNPGPCGQNAQVPELLIS